MITIEPFDIHSVVNGRFRLDGGAMFGVVPKVMWEPKTGADELNRIPLAMRTLVAIERGGAGRVILVDTGAGSKWSPEEAARYAIESYPSAIEDCLRAAGRSGGEVTDVVVTHLHFDHNGGLLDWVDRAKGVTRLRYPQARHWIHRKAWEHAHKPFFKDKASFLPRDFRGLEEAGVLRFVEGETPPAPFEGVEWFVSHGHTPFQLLPILGERGGRRLLFVGDVIPTANHVGLPWVMAYDVEPLRTIAEKEEIYRRCRDEGLLLAFPHDPVGGGVEVDGVVPQTSILRRLEL